MSEIGWGEVVGSGMTPNPGMAAVGAVGPAPEALMDTCST